MRRPRLELVALRSGWVCPAQRGQHRRADHHVAHEQPRQPRTLAGQHDLRRRFALSQRLLGLHCPVGQRHCVRLRARSAPAETHGPCSHSGTTYGSFRTSCVIRMAMIVVGATVHAELVGGVVVVALVSQNDVGLDAAECKRVEEHVASTTDSVVRDGLSTPGAARCSTWRATSSRKAARRMARELDRSLRT
jgi:hypothetical protein